jgi:hypothetical protein
MMEIPAVSFILPLLQSLGVFFSPPVGSNIKAIPPASSISRVICDAISAEQAAGYHIVLYKYTVIVLADHERLHHDLLLKMRSSSRKKRQPKFMSCGPRFTRRLIYF